MAKIDVAGLDKAKIVEHVFKYLSADGQYSIPLKKDGSTNIEAIKNIAKMVWGIDCDSPDTQIDDTGFLSRHPELKDFLQSIVYEMRQELKKHKEKEQAKQADSAPPGYDESIARAVAALQREAEQKIKSEVTSEQDERLAWEQKQKAKEEAHRREMIENARLAREHVDAEEQKAKEETARRLQIEQQMKAMLQKAKELEERIKQEAEIKRKLEEEAKRKEAEALKLQQLLAEQLKQLAAAKEKAVADPTKPKDTKETKETKESKETKETKEAKEKVQTTTQSPADAKLDEEDRMVEMTQLQARQREDKEQKAAIEGLMAIQKLLLAQKERKEHSELLDSYKNRYVNNWLAEHKLLSEVNNIYLTKKSKSINILSSSEAHAKLIFESMQKELGNIGRKGNNPEELSIAFYPPKIFDSLFGFQIPFQKNAISGDNDTTPVLAGGRLEGKLEVKIPYIRISDAKKLVYYIVQRLENGITENSLAENLLSLEDLLPLLPEVPTDAKTTSLIESYADIIRYQDSEVAPGYGRVLFDNFEVFAEKIGSKIKSDGLRKTIVEGESGQTPLIRQLQYGVAVSESEFYALHATDNGERVHFRVGTPAYIPGLKSGDISVPVNLNNPKKPFDKNVTTLVLDTSGSMDGAEGRLDRLKQGLIETVKLLANKPNQYLTLICFDDRTKHIFDNVQLTKDSLPGIIEKIKSIRAGGGTDAQPALEEVFRNLPNRSKRDGVRENHKIILGTDGEFNYFDKSKLMKILEEKELPLMSVFAIDFADNARGVENLENLTGMCAAGSQLIFTKKEDIPNTVKQLMLEQVNRRIETLKVEIEGAVPRIRTLPPCAANTVVQRMVDIPEKLVEEAKRTGKPIKLTFDITYDDGSKRQESVEVTPQMLNTTEVATPRFTQDYLNQWYQHELYKNGKTQFNQLNLESLEEQLKLLSKIKGTATLAGIPDHITPDISTYILAKWFRQKQRELDEYQYKNNVEARLKKLKENIAEAEKYGFLDVAYAFQDEAEVIENDIWMNNTIVNLVNCCFPDIKIKSEAELVHYPQVDAGMLVDIYRQVIERAKVQGKSQELIEKLKARISPYWLHAELIEASDKLFNEKFKNLTIEQQLKVVNDIRAKAENDPLITEQHRKNLAQFWINRELAATFAKLHKEKEHLLQRSPQKEIVEQIRVIAKTVVQADPVPPVPSRRFVRRHRWHQRPVAQPVPAALSSTVNVAVKEMVEVVTLDAMHWMKLELLKSHDINEHQSILKQLQEKIAELGYKDAENLINNMATDQKKTQEESAQVKPAEMLVLSYAEPVKPVQRVEHTYNPDDATGNQNAAPKRRYVRRALGAVARACVERAKDVAPKVPQLAAQSSAASMTVSMDGLYVEVRVPVDVINPETNLLDLLIIKKPENDKKPLMLSGGPDKGSMSEEEMVARAKAQANAKKFRGLFNKS